MATPTKAPGVSTPKNSINTTPNRPISSPRPTSLAMQNRPVAGKSPVPASAAKTPASLHGHSHRISMSSSQPTSTPAAPAIHDALLNLNSPAADLIAQIGSTGLTPLAAAQEGLVLAGGMVPNAMQGSVLARNPDMNREHRLKEVAHTLKSKATGRGITREEVQRLAQFHGFAPLWDEKTLTIAGTSVDLEIVFDRAERDQVEEVTLRLSTPDSDEPQLQKGASVVLQQHLCPAPETSRGGIWPSLAAFSSDLEYLGKHDFAGCPVNCFGLIGGLYETFRKIWDEEKRRMKDRHRIQHICQSNVGEPLMDVGHLGPSTCYWTNKRTYHTTVHSKLEAEIDPNDAWVARFNCEKGMPGINSDQEWLDDDVLNKTVTTEDVFQEAQVDKPSWRTSNSIPEHSVRVDDSSADVMDVDNALHRLTKPLNVHYVCNLEPAVLLPVNVAAGFNDEVTMLNIDQTELITYQEALRASHQIRATQMATTLYNVGGDDRWDVSRTVFDEEGVQHPRNYSYHLSATGGTWSYSVSHFWFSHPRQYTAAVPVLRQYAMLWTLLHKTSDGVVDVVTRSAPVSLPSRLQPNGTVTRRNNKKKAQIDLEQLMATREMTDGDLKIDLCLDLISSLSSATVDVIIAGPRLPGFIRAMIEVKRNGILEVTSISGPSSLTEEKVKRAATRVLNLSEDIGVLAEWLQDVARNHK